MSRSEQVGFAFSKIQLPKAYFNKETVIPINVLVCPPFQELAVATMNEVKWSTSGRLRARTMSTTSSGGRRKRRLAQKTVKGRRKETKKKRNGTQRRQKRMKTMMMKMRRRMREIYPNTICGTRNQKKRGKRRRKKRKRILRLRREKNDQSLVPVPRGLGRGPQAPPAHGHRVDPVPAKAESDDIRVRVPPLLRHPPQRPVPRDPRPEVPREEGDAREGRMEETGERILRFLIYVKWSENVKGGEDLYSSNCLVENCNTEYK